MSRLNSLPSINQGMDADSGRGPVNISQVMNGRETWTRVRDPNQNFAHFKGILSVKDAVKRFNRYLETL